MATFDSSTFAADVSSTARAIHEPYVSIQICFFRKAQNQPFAPTHHDFEQ